MRFSAAILLALLSATLSISSAAADVRVTFVNSFRYSDLADMSPTKRDAILTDIRKTLAELGAHYLAPKTTLTIEILDMAPIDIVIQPPTPTGKTGSASTDARPMQLDLQYVLHQDGKTIQGDRETISDINYFTNPPPPPPNESDEHKKPVDPKLLMLRDWFIKRFVAPTDSDN